MVAGSGVGGQARRKRRCLRRRYCWYSAISDRPVPANAWDPWFFEAVDRAYLEFDDTRQMLERALELSSQELVRANSELRAADSDHRADSGRGRRGARRLLAGGDGRLFG
jgi:hypothetical protein